MARSRYKIFDGDENAPYFLTATIVNWLPLFNAPWVVDILFDSLRFLQESERLVLYAYVIMENHLHLIASAMNLSKEMGNFKSFTARQIIDRYQERGAEHILEQLAWHKRPYKPDRNHQFWQEGSHPQRIQGVEMMRQKVAYIHNNPVRRGWVDDPVHWRYSSAKNYADMSGLLGVQTEW
ncbi:MAG: transposase [Chloroflexi bacterium]|nr:transposase [Chloroflexota bacterium]